jgi:hypothetical protein
MIEEIENSDDFIFCKICGFKSKIIYGRHLIHMV